MSTSDKQCRIIALFNQAGGVAKSTLTQNLGYHLAKREHRVLLMENSYELVTELLRLSPNKRKYYQQGERAMRLILSAS